MRPTFGFRDTHLSLVHFVGHIEKAANAANWPGPMSVYGSQSNRWRIALMFS
jgi:hypothetical protein